MQKRRTAALATPRLGAVVIYVGAAFHNFPASIEKVDLHFFSLQVSLSTLLDWGLKS